MPARRCQHAVKCYDLVHRVNTECVLDILYDFWCGRECVLPVLRDKLRRLRKLSPGMTSFYLRVDLDRCAADGVARPYIVGQTTDGGQHYALDFTSAREWLAMPVVRANEIAHWDDEIVMAAILWEMTWAGFDSDNIRARKRGDLPQAADVIAGRITA